MANVVYKKVVKKTTVREELEYWNVIYIIRRLNAYFNKLHGYDRGLRGLSADDFSMTVLEKIINGKMSWENSTKTDFLDFCFNCMRSELGNYRKSKEVRTIESRDFSFENEIRWDRIGLKDEFNGF